MCLECLFLIPEAAPFGNKSAYSDIKVAEYLCIAGAQSAGENIDINLPSIKDTEYVKQVEAKLKKFRDSLEKAIRQSIPKPA